jgi:hypothetical protein
MSGEEIVEHGGVVGFLKLTEFPAGCHGLDKPGLAGRKAYSFRKEFLEMVLEDLLQDAAGDADPDIGAPNGAPFGDQRPELLGVSLSVQTESEKSSPTHVLGAVWDQLIAHLEDKAAVAAYQGPLFQVVNAHAAVFQPAVLKQVPQAATFFQAETDVEEVYSPDPSVNPVH